ncbi:MAG: alanyl-tRNA editing protein [Alicyclobacillus macrosporangiidus]|uniref:alanyl-tRNA editing protein n=1 Tax=Alicyclobacillus macrosporangiidus TaxID=392015 RepID=UPI0026EFE202|nr:alanyl-tRNA editing protein [Alicyclobacillus macrosporangiidus]MCL6600489.1 alanyl-tRNA editing protein [Alicyclobacillus macrosporangiidus]
MSLAEKRLYYHDSYRTRFTGVVTSCRQAGGRWLVRLDQTAFYPTSGGQPHDTGRLGPAQVLDVFVEEGEVVHATDRPLPTGEAAEGEIDWERRHDFMQQHCGQHVLSASFERLYDIDTVGFHLGDEWVTVDLDAELTWDQVAEAERLANQVVWEDRPVYARFVTEEELAVLPLRRPPKVDEDVRIVTIEGFDHNPCGGTHPRRTGEIGLIKVVKMERMRGGTRLTFVCGKRALRVVQARFEAVNELARRLSVSVEDLPAAVEKLSQEAQGAQKRMRMLQDQWLDLRAKALVRRVAPEGGEPPGRPWVCEALEDVDTADALRGLAQRVAAREDGATVCALAADTGERVSLVVVSRDPRVDAAAVVRAALEPHAGRGGGNAKQGQGSAPSAPGTDASAVCDTVRRVLASFA